MPLYDEDGNVVAGTEKMKPEDLKKMFKELGETTEELEKLRKKDLNFEKLRKFKLLSELSEEEKEEMSQFFIQENN